MELREESIHRLERVNLTLWPQIGQFHRVNSDVGSGLNNDRVRWEQWQKQLLGDVARAALPSSCSPKGL
jgi:hypothetical protein